MSILILKEKHGDRHFSFSDDKELQLLASYIVRERHEEGWYDSALGATLAYALEGNNKAALTFLRGRQDYEYEDFEIVEPETVKGLKL